MFFVPCWLLFPGRCFMFLGVVCTLPVFIVPWVKVFAVPWLSWAVPCLEFSGSRRCFSVPWAVCFMFPQCTVTGVRRPCFTFPPDPADRRLKKKGGRNRERARERERERDNKRKTKEEIYERNKGSRKKSRKNKKTRTG